jgi:hypothetical protein
MKTTEKEKDMSVFDQRGQKVKYQYNVAGDLNMEAVQSREEAVRQLEKLVAELQRAIQAGVIEGGATDAAQEHLKKAAEEAGQEAPDKEGILAHVDRAKTVIEGVAAAGGLVGSLVKAAEMVQNFF